MPTTSRCVFAAITLAAVALVAQPADADLATPSCPQTSNATVFVGPTLTPDCGSSTSTGCTVKQGTVGSGAVIQLQNNGASFQTTSISTVSNIVFAAVGDFNNDGWPDFVGTPVTTANSPLTVFQNETWANEGCATPACATRSPAPNWALAITPKFVNAENLKVAPNPTTDNGWFTVAGGDFNGDGWDDVFEVYAHNTGAHSGFDYFNRMSLYRST